MIFYKVYQWDLTVHIGVLVLLKLGDTQGKKLKELKDRDIHLLF